MSLKKIQLGFWTEKMSELCIATLFLQAVLQRRN